MAQLSKNKTLIIYAIFANSLCAFASQKEQKSS